MEVMNMKAIIQISKNNLNSLPIMKNYFESYMNLSGEKYSNLNEQMKIIKPMKIDYKFKDETSKDPKLLACIKVDDCGTITWELNMKYIINCFYNKHFNITECRIIDVSNGIIPVFPKNMMVDFEECIKDDSTQIITLELSFSNIRDVSDFISAESDRLLKLQYNKNNNL